MTKVFLSSTSKDLSDYRQKVAAAINDLADFECIQMETWGAVNARPADYDAAKVAECDLFVLLLGAIYGECKPGTEKSFTELEYDQAVELDKPRIAFSASDDCQFPRSVTKSRPAGDSERLEAFCQRVRQERIWAEFIDPHQLANQVTKAILKWQEESRQAALERFLTHTIETNSQISLRGVMQIERQVAVELDEVYVSLKTEREVQETRIGFGRMKVALLPVGKDGRLLINPPEDDFKEIAPIPGSRVRWAERAETRTEKVDLAEAVREHRRIVILGDPGAGKTTLMRFLALHFARGWRGGLLTVTDKDGNDYGKARLPILMRVAEYAEALRLNRNAKLRDCLLVPFRNLERNSDGELTRLLEEKLRRGEALLLLDGLDEVTEPSDRVLISNQIEEFVRNTHRDNRVIVTSRIVGYRQAPLGSDYQHFTLLDLEREQIEKFLNGWCFAVERFLSPTTSEEEITRRAKAEIDGILKSVDDNTGVKRLATNPLLLTILAMIHRNGSRLPSRRVELYELAANSLLSDWLAAKGMDSGKHISRADAAQFLWPLAFWMHSERPSGLAYEQEVEEKLRQFRSRDTGKPPDHPEVIAAVDDFLARASQSTGIFVLRAPKQFGFLHLTFQEYFAALELTRNSLQMAQRIHEVRHRPRWEEPILLAIASRQSPDDADMLVRSAILAEGELAQQQGFKPSEYEDILHRDLFLAARCLADDVPVYPELRQQIVNRLCELYFDPKTHDSLTEGIRQSFALLGGSKATDDLIEVLLGRLTDSEKSVRSAAVRELGAMGEKVASNQVITALIQLLSDSEEYVQSAAAEALGAMGEKAASDQVIAALVERLADSDEDVRYVAAWALGNLGEKATSEQVLTALIERLADSDEDVRSAAARALGAMGEKAANDQVIAALIQLLSDSEGGVRSAAADALGAMGEKAASEQALTALVERLADSEWNVRYVATWTLGNLGEKAASDQALTVLVERLANSEGNVRSAAARGLGVMGEKAANDQVLTALVERLADSDEDVRYVAAWALGNLGEKVASDQVIAALVERLADSDEDVRYVAAWALGNLGEKAASDQFISALIQLLSDSEGYVRSAAADALEAMGEKAASDQIITVLIQLLSDSEAYVRSAAAGALGAMGEKAASDQIITTLIQLLSDSDWEVRSASASALGAMGEKAASVQVITALIQLLSDSELSERDAAVGSLGKLVSYVKEEGKPKIIKLALPLARNKRRGEKNDSKREAGYVMLRNLLAVEK